jgi:hypothetical protein
MDHGTAIMNRKGSVAEADEPGAEKKKQDPSTVCFANNLHEASEPHSKAAHISRRVTLNHEPTKTNDDATRVDNEVFRA